MNPSRSAAAEPDRVAGDAVDVRACDLPRDAGRPGGPDSAGDTTSARDMATACEADSARDAESAGESTDVPDVPDVPDIPDVPDVHGRPAGRARARARVRRVGGLVAAGVAGTVGTALVVATGGRLALGPRVRPPTAWFGLLDPVPTDRPSMLPVVLLAGAALLIGAWWWVCQRCQRGELSLRGAAALVACWSLAPLVGPPILSLDVYSYVAQGVMLSAGLNPYDAGPALLGSHPAGLAADPFWEHTPSPYGPVGLWLFHAVTSVTGGRVVRSVLVLRAVTLLAIAVIAWCLVKAAPPARRPWALVAGVGGPLVLLELLGGVHLEAVMMALAAVGLLAALRGRAGPGLALLTAAALTKWPAAVILLVVLARRWLDLATATGEGRARRLLAAVGRDLAVVVVTAAALSLLLVPDGFGWVRTTAAPTAGLNLYSPVSAVANLLAMITGTPGPAMPGSDALRIARAGGLAVAAVIIGWLFATVRTRDVPATCGLALLCLALLGPVLHPWYLVWGMIPLTMSRGTRHGPLLVAVGALGTLLSVPHPELLFVGEPSVVAWFSREGPVVLALVALCVGALVVAARRGGHTPRPGRAL